MPCCLWMMKVSRNILVLNFWMNDPPVMAADVPFDTALIRVQRRVVLKDFHAAAAVGDIWVRLVVVILGLTVDTCRTVPAEGKIFPYVVLGKEQKYLQDGGQEDAESRHGDAFVVQEVVTSSRGSTDSIVCQHYTSTSSTRLGCRTRYDRANLNVW